MMHISSLYGIKPTRARGQNFLIDEKTYDEIIEAAHLKKDESVLEVGPGLGFLTSLLARNVKKVIAVELDKKLSQTLENRFQLEDIKNVSIFNEDVMNFTGDWAKETEKIPSNELVVVANLPYTITSIFLRYFVGGNIKNILPNRFVLMLQKEVAQRIVAQAGALSKLALSVQLYADVSIIKIVPRKYFWPSPEVDSAIISIQRTDRWTKRLGSHERELALLRIIRIGFSAKRKMLKANLAAGLHVPVDRILEYFSQLGINPSARPQELSLENWLGLLPFLE
jgi:16S rRNA (adenine1518-N6/adenine1519-N6)-dimethyltransferase